MTMHFAERMCFLRFFFGFLSVSQSEPEYVQQGKSAVCVKSQMVKRVIR